MNASLTIFKQRFRYWEFLLLFLTFFVMEGIFSWLFLRNSIITEGAIKLTSIFIYGYMLFNYFGLKKDEKIVTGLFTLLMLRLVFESMFSYGTVFRQLTMFTVLFPVIYVVFMKHLLGKLNIDLLGFMARFYLITYILFMALFGRNFSFGLELWDMEDYGPFSGDSRVIHASHIFMMIVPFLWYLHDYISRRKTISLILFMVCAAVILVHQHRSVWSSTLVAGFFYLLAAIRNHYIIIKRLISISILSIIGIAVLTFFISHLFPGFLDFMGERFAEILDPSKEGSTGNFRIEQREVYGALAWERPIFGWTFEGFEMPNPLVDWWPPMSGQHFHEGYMEMFFYQGAVGLLFKYSFLLYMLYKIFSRNISIETIILMSLGIAGLIFSLNYVMPLIFWGHVGMGLYYLEKDQERKLHI